MNVLHLSIVVLGMRDVKVVVDEGNTFGMGHN